jgi:hypothetical protein
MVEELPWLSHALAQQKRLQGLSTLLASLSLNLSGFISYLKRLWGSPYRAFCLNSSRDPFGFSCSPAVHSVTAQPPLSDRPSCAELKLRSFNPETKQCS